MTQEPQPSLEITQGLLKIPIYSFFLSPENRGISAAACIEPRLVMNGSMFLEDEGLIC